MNTQLANSLAEAASALSLEDFQAFQASLLEHIRFYANENLTADLVGVLQQLGHDVLTSYETGNVNQCIPDEI